MPVTRLVSTRDAKALAALVTRNREFLAPWRDQMAWTLGLLALFAASAGVIARLMLHM